MVVVGAVGTLVTVAAVALFSPELRRFGRLDQDGVERARKNADSAPQAVTS